MKTTKEYGDNCIILEPHKLTIPETILARTLQSMDQAINTLKQERISEAIDLSDF